MHTQIGKKGARHGTATTCLSRSPQKTGRYLLAEQMKIRSSKLQISGSRGGIVIVEGGVGVDKTIFVTTEKEPRNKDAQWQRLERRLEDDDFVDQQLDRAIKGMMKRKS